MWIKAYKPDDRRITVLTVVLPSDLLTSVDLKW